MGNQRPPGGFDSPTEDPDQERNKPGGTPPERHYAPAEFQPPPQRPPASPQPWADPERTQPYVPGRRSIAERLRQQTREPETAPPPEPPPPPSPQTPQQAARPGWQARVQQRAEAQARSGSRGRGAIRLVAILAGVVVLGLAAGAGAAWFSGWRPGFLASKTDETKPPDTTTAKPGDTPPAGDKPPETKPPEPPPTTSDLARSCFTGRTEVKAGPGACGFTIEAGAVSFKGQRITDRLAVGNAAAQRLLLYPLAPSGRFVFLRACETASGGRCAVQRLVDTKEKKVFEIKGDAEDLRWVAFSPKEEVGLLFYRDGTADSVAAVATADGKQLLNAAIKSARNEYAMVRERTLRWPDEASFSIEVKLCPFERAGRNAKCEQDDKVRFRRRLVKLAR